MAVRITVSDRIAMEIRECAYDETINWPDDTAFQDDLAKLVARIDAKLPDENAQRREPHEHARSLPRMPLSDQFRPGDVSSVPDARDRGRQRRIPP